MDLSFMMHQFGYKDTCIFCVERKFFKGYRCKNHDILTNKYIALCMLFILKVIEIIIYSSILILQIINLIILLLDQVLKYFDTNLELFILSV
jgi:hypothetical protein